MPLRTMIKAYYNEFDKKAAAGLRELIKAGLIADGEVDERSIIDVEAADLVGFTQHHFFAGIGGWGLALRLAGWPDDKHVWTASLPCQPFSAAGKGLGKADERHLLPHFLELVGQCRPATIFGEQVSAAIKHGWLDDLYAEMEGSHYSCWSAIIGAHSVGSAHIRQRLYWVANAINHSGERSLGRVDTETQICEISNRKNIACAGESCGTGEHVRGMANGNEQGLQGRTRAERTDQQLIGQDSVVNGLVHPNESRSQQRIETTEAARYGDSVESTGSINWLGDSEHEQHKGRVSGCGEKSSTNRESSVQFAGSSAVGGLSDTKGIGRGILDAADIWQANGESHSLTDSSNSFDQQSQGLRFTDVEWIYCRDNKYRPIKPGIQPLVDGLPRGMVYSLDSSAPINANATQEARAMRLKGYGNAIVPQVAAAFIESFMDCQ